MVFEQEAPAKALLGFFQILINVHPGKAKEQVLPILAGLFLSTSFNDPQLLEYTVSILVSLLSLFPQEYLRVVEQCCAMEPMQIFSPNVQKQFLASLAKMKTLKIKKIVKQFTGGKRKKKGV